MKKEFYIRKFLNSEKGSDRIEVDEESVSIATRHKAVLLDFYLDNNIKYTTRKEVDISEEKIDILFDTIKQFRTHHKTKINRLRKQMKADGR